MEASRERTSGSRISVQKNFYNEQVWLTHEYYKWTLRTGKLAQCKCFIGRRYGDRMVKALQPLQKAICLRVNLHSDLCVWQPCDAERHGASLRAALAIFFRKANAVPTSV